MHKMVSQNIHLNQDKELDFNDHQLYPLIMKSNLKIYQASSEVLIWLAYPAKGLEALECKRDEVWKLS